MARRSAKQKAATRKLIALNKKRAHKGGKRKSRKGKKSRKRRSAAQRAATRKLVALNKARAGKGKKRSKKRKGGGKKRRSRRAHGGKKRSGGKRRSKRRSSSKKRAHRGKKRHGRRRGKKRAHAYHTGSGYNAGMAAYNARLARQHGDPRGLNVVTDYMRAQRAKIVAAKAAGRQGSFATSNV